LRGPGFWEGAKTFQSSEPKNFKGAQGPDPWPRLPARANAFPKGPSRKASVKGTGKGTTQRGAKVIKNAGPFVALFFCLGMGLGGVFICRFGQVDSGPVNRKKVTSGENLRAFGFYSIPAGPCLFWLLFPAKFKFDFTSSGLVWRDSKNAGALGLSRLKPGGILAFQVSVLLFIRSQASFPRKGQKGSRGEGVGPHRRRNSDRLGPGRAVVGQGQRDLGGQKKTAGPPHSGFSGRLLLDPRKEKPARFLSFKPCRWAKGRTGAASGARGPPFSWCRSVSVFSGRRRFSRRA